MLTSDLKLSLIRQIADLPENWLFELNALMNEWLSKKKEIEKPSFQAEDIENNAWLEAMSKNPSFDFLNEEAENIYTLQDGKPFKN